VAAVVPPCPSCSPWGAGWPAAATGISASWVSTAPIFAVWIALLLRQRHQRLAALGDFGTLRVSSNTPKRRLAAHRLVYTLMLIVLAFSLITGMAMVKPAQLWWLVGLFSFAVAAGRDSWEVLRVCHLATIPAIALLLAAHLVLSWRVGGLRLRRSMAL
jgi:thiosulfate reductase cytochrome b subunit